MTQELVIGWLGIAMMAMELVILVAIWLDGKKMLKHEAAIERWEGKVYSLYEKYFEKREVEREARNEVRRNARAAKREADSNNAIT